VAVRRLEEKDSRLIQIEAELGLHRVNDPTGIQDALDTLAELLGEASVAVASLSTDGVGMDDLQLDILEALVPVMRRRLGVARPLRSADHPRAASAPTFDERIAGAVTAAATRGSLTPRQQEVLGLVVRGHANAAIAGWLGVSTRAVELHVTAILDRSGADNRASLVSRVLA